MRHTLLASLVALTCLADRAPAAEPSWAFQTPRRPAIPTVRTAGRVVNPIDAFILARLEKKGLTLSAEADRVGLLRRVTFDLTGLPPTPAEIDAFLKDPSPDAYEKVVDRLLSSPRFGERWAQHWLDLVRYAESDGFKEDALRPAAHRYRDYVIKSFNDDLPYDRFLRQQLAGDELEPDNPDALVATGFLRLYPDEYNAANLEQRRQEILDDVTDTTGFTFLGLTVGCARCHDHKFDPTSQADYFSLQAFFAPMQPRDDLAADAPARLKKYRDELAAWEKTTKPIRDEIDALVGKKQADARKYTLGRFGADIQAAVNTPPEKRTPYQEQIAAIAEKQLVRAEEEAPKKLTADLKKKYEELQAKLAAHPRPKEPAPVMAVHDVGRTAPPTYRLQGGNWFKPAEELQPDFPKFLGRTKVDTSLPSDRDTTGRRAALARWLTNPDHPLTARVIANRLWQHHFGVGIVPTASDFGLQGEKPTHPELLDWLARDLTDNRWSLKHLHRLMVTSAAYKQSSAINRENSDHARALTADPDNGLLWHARRRRLEAEPLRDAMLAISGDLSPRMHGPSAKPVLPEGISKYAWKPDANPADQNRRSVYVLARRNMRFPLFDAFDLPDLHNSCSRRAQTTTAPQALMLLNGEFAQDRARRWATQLLKQHDTDLSTLASSAYHSAWGRTATVDEVRLAVAFIEKQSKLAGGRQAAVIDFCHAVLNANETLYVD